MKKRIITLTEKDLHKVIKESVKKLLSEGIIDKAKNAFKPKEMSQEELDALREKTRKLGEYCNEHPNDEFAYYKYLKLARKAYK